MKTVRNENGIVFAIVLVFVLVLMISGYSVSGLTRTNTQIVTNLRNEKESFYLAESGLTEARLRLAMPQSTMVTIDGRTFDASIKPDKNQPNWTGYILAGSFDPGTSGNTFTTPTIQPAADRLAYSSAAAGPEAITLRWVKNGGQILRIGADRVLEVTTVGQSGKARRRVSVQLAVPEGYGFFAMHPTACGSADIGSAVVDLYAPLVVNSSCGTALNTKNSSVMTATGGIDVVGGWNGSGVVAPTPKTSQPYVPDPLAGVPAPVLADHPVRNGTPTSPSSLQISGNANLQPGVYYGGIKIQGNGTVTMQPGLYIMAGGGFALSGQTVVFPTVNAASGVTIYNTNAPQGGNQGSYGELSFTGSANLNVRAPSNGPYKGILLFNDRANPADIKLSGSGVNNFQWDGGIYALSSTVRVSGVPKSFRGEFVAGQFNFSSGVTVVKPTHSAFDATSFRQLAWQDW